VKVNVPDKSMLVGEQKGALDGEPEVGYIAEMVTEPAKLSSFGFDKAIVGKADALKLANNDETPEFPVVRVEEGWSGSHRLYDKTVMESIVSQTNELEPVAHLGHIPDEQVSTAFPPPQTVWIGALTKQEASQQKTRLGEQVTVAYFAGYNLPSADIRTKSYIKNKVVRGISWWGIADLVPIPGKGVAVKTLELKALDWARKLAEGMPTSRVVAMAREMKESAKMEKELSQVSPAEFKEANPNGYALLVSEVTAEKDKTIGEMEAKVEEGKKHKTLLDQVMAVLGIEDMEALASEVTKLKEKVGEKASLMVKDALAKLLEEKVPNEEKRALVTRLLPVGEMETRAADAKDGAEVTKIVGEMLETAFDKDEHIQTLISEQAPPNIRRREELGSHDKNLDKNEYVTRERVSLR
jgi:hypothetical protein